MSCHSAPLDPLPEMASGSATAGGSALAQDRATVEIRDPLFMFVLNDLIHDATFSTADIKVDQTRRSVMIPFAREDYRRQATKDGSVGLWRSAGVMSIQNVTAQALPEEDAIGLLNVVSYDANSGQVRVKTMITDDITVAVDDLHIIATIGGELEAVPGGGRGGGCLWRTLTSIFVR